MARGLLSHVEINVSNLERSLAFWGWFLGELGYSSHQSWPQGKSWKLGDTYIVIVQTETAFLPSGYHRKNTGLNHLAFHARDKDDVERMTAALQARGVVILYPDRHPHAAGADRHAVFFEDPDRIKVEFSATPGD